MLLAPDLPKEGLGSIRIRPMLHLQLWRILTMAAIGNGDPWLWRSETWPNLNWCPFGLLVTT